MYTKDVVLPTIEQIKLAEISVYDRIVDAVVSRKQGNQAISMAQGYLLFEHNNGIINVGGEDGR
jgi:predicted secreted protein